MHTIFLGKLCFSKLKSSLSKGIDHPLTNRMDPPLLRNIIFCATILTFSHPLTTATYT